MLKAQNRTPYKRLFILSVATIVLLIILLIKFFILQVIDYQRYAKKANVNRVRATTLHAPRGLILDRNGEVIVDNSPTYVLTAIPYAISDLPQTLRLLEKYTGIDSSLFAKNYKKYYNGRFTAARIAKDVSFEQICKLEERKIELPGINYEQVFERYYPSGMRGAHVLGYVTEVDQNIKKKIKNGGEYELSDLIGWQGIEKVYEAKLKDKKGVIYREVDAFGRNIGEISDFEKILPESGNDLITTLDINLQKFVEDIMVDKRGCVIIGEPKSGEILAFVNSPDYAPDFFTGTTTNKEWNQIISNPDRPLMNRISDGTYPPGSIYKMITAAYILNSGIISSSKTYYCGGSYKFGNRRFGCWDPAGHGNVNLEQAIVQSCDVYFYNVIQQISLNDWAALCRKFGFGLPTGIDLPSEKKGNVPDEEYFNRRYGKKGWTNGLKLNLVIGQGETLVTPLQLLSYINMLATNGENHILHLDKNKSLEKYDSPELLPKTWSMIRQYIKMVVTSEKGTGRLVDPKIDGLQVYGKTGTAENPHGEPHAWFIGFAEIEEKSVSFVVLIENAGHGGDIAAPIAREFLNYIYAKPIDSVLTIEDNGNKTS